MRRLPLRLRMKARRSHLQSVKSRLTEISSHVQNQLSDADWATKHEIIRALFSGSKLGQRMLPLQNCLEGATIMAQHVTDENNWLRSCFYRQTGRPRCLPRGAGRKDSGDGGGP